MLAAPAVTAGMTAMVGVGAVWSFGDKEVTVTDEDCDAADVVK